MGAELHVHADAVPIDRFVPVPPDAQSRRVFIARNGLMDVYVIDPVAMRHHLAMVRRRMRG